MAAKLYEYMSFDKGHMKIEESVVDGTGKKECFMKGIFIQGDVRNQNQRVYPLREITRAVDSLNEKISGGFTVLGELDHPEELTINLDRVSHIIESMWINGADGYGSLKIIDTPLGQIVKTLLQSGAKLGVSSRGSGSVDDDGAVSEFDIITVDIVAQPSAPDAYPRTIYESLYNMKGGAQIFETAKSTLFDPSAQKYLDKEIIKYIREMKF